MLKLNKNYKATVKAVKKEADSKRVVVEISITEAPELPARYYPTFNLGNEAGKRYYDSVKDSLVKDAEIEVYFTKSVSSTGVKMVNCHIDTTSQFFEDEGEEEAF